MKFPDGQVREYAANVIAENMLRMTGSVALLMHSIVDYRRDATAVPIQNKYITIKSGQRRLQKTTHYKWKDGATTNMEFTSWWEITIFVRLATAMFYMPY